MDQTPTPPQEESHFSAVLTPYRSLPPRGFLILMSAIGLVSFVAGFAFYLLGAWPVLGFFGLDVLLIYIAFRLNYRAARLYETIDLKDDALIVKRVRPSGHVESWNFNPYWVNLNLAERTGRQPELTLSSHGRQLVFGQFLTETEKREFADALSGALLEQRGGIRI